MDIICMCQKTDHYYNICLGFYKHKIYKNVEITATSQKKCLRREVNLTDWLTILLSLRSTKREVYPEEPGEEPITARGKSSRDFQLKIGPTQNL